MLSLRRPSLPFQLLTAATLLFLVWHYGHVLRDPFGVLLSDSGDGLKNYFTYAWHIAIDPQALNYTGSSHPYGEHVFYTDGHPLLTWLLRPLPVGGGVAVGLLNLLLILGMLAGAWCYHALLRHFGLAAWAAALGAFGLMALQPQVFRLGGHLSLAHAWVLPLAWLLTLRSQQGDKVWRWTWAATLLSTATYLVHPYLGLMVGLFQGSFLLITLLQQWRASTLNKSAILRAAVLLALPLLVFALGFLFGPGHADRPGTPGGADELSTRVLSLLVPTHPPLSTPLAEFFRYEALQWETWCYLGLSTILVLVALGGGAVQGWVRREPGGRRELDALQVSFVAGAVALLFAMGILAEWLGSALPLLKQFRGSGRFAWVFWTVAAVFTLVMAYRHLLPDHRIRTRGLVVFAALAGFLFVEGWAQHARTGESIGRTPNLFRWRHLPAELQELVDRARSEDFAALIPLPLMHVGSEHYQRDTRDGIMRLMMPLAYHAQLPIMAGITSRASLSETRALLSVLAPTDFDRNALARHYAADARFLIAHSDDALDENEQALLARGTLLHSNARGKLYSIRAAELFRQSTGETLERFRSANMPERASCNGAWHSTSDGSPVDCELVHHAYSADTLHGISGEWATIAEFPAGTLDATRTYEVGFVFRAVDGSAVNTNLILDHFRPDGGENEWERLVGMRGMPMQWDGLTFATLTFRPVHGHKVYKFMLNGPEKNRGRFTVQHLYVRPVDVDVWRPVELDGRSVLLRNNVPLEPLPISAAGP